MNVENYRETCDELSRRRRLLFIAREQVATCERRLTLAVTAMETAETECRAVKRPDRERAAKLLEMAREALGVEAVS